MVCCAWSWYLLQRSFRRFAHPAFWSGLLLKCSEVTGPNRSSYWSASVSVGNHRRQVPLPRFASNGGGAGRTRALDDSFLSLEKCFFVLFARRSGGCSPPCWCSSKTFSITSLEAFGKSHCPLGTCTVHPNDPTSRHREFSRSAADILG